MPNWCCCQINIEGRGLDVLQCINSMKGKRAYYKEDSDETCTREWKDKICYTFNATVPIPSAIMARSYNDAGYDAQIQLWGVKWDMLGDATEKLDQIAKECYENLEEYRQYSFSLDTPWGPPMRWFEKLVKKFPILTFEMLYEEGGMGIYGRCIYHLGELCDEERYNSESEYRYYTNDKELSWVVDDVYMSIYEGMGDMEEEKKAMLDDFSWYEDKEEIEKVIDDYLKEIY